MSIFSLGCVMIGAGSVRRVVGNVNGQYCHPAKILCCIPPAFAPTHAAMILKPMLADFEARALALGKTMPQICEAAKVHYSTYWRMNKLGTGGTISTLEKIQFVLDELEAAK